MSTPERPQIKPGTLWLIGSAIDSLAKIPGDPSQHIDKALSNARSALSSIEEFTAKQLEQPKWSEEQAELSSNLHTWLRKYEDSPVSAILYRMIAEDFIRVQSAWDQFKRITLCGD